LSFGKKEEQIFLGREIAQHRDYSEETAIKIDEQVRLLVEGAYARASGIIDERAQALVRIAETLLEREVLDGSEVTALIEGAAAAAALESASDDAPGSQQVIRPEGGRRAPGLLEGERPQPA
jgi:cell division protease FtsH